MFDGSNYMYMGGMCEPEERDLVIEWKLWEVGNAAGPLDCTEEKPGCHFTHRLHCVPTTDTDTSGTPHWSPTHRVLAPSTRHNHG